MVRWIGLLLAIFVSWPSQGQQNFSGSQVLQILSYNVKGLPWSFGKVNGKSAKKRCRLIGDYMGEQRQQGRAPQIVLLQEMMIAECQELIDRAGYPHHYFVLKEGSRTYGSGLAILSEFKILDPVKVLFSSDCEGGDCFSSKGVLGVRVHPPQMPEPILIMTTHLQAKKANDEIRQGQMDQITGQFFHKVSGQHLVKIIAGDFNSKPDRPSYQYFLNQSQFTDSGRWCLANPTACEPVYGGLSTLDDIWRSNKDRHFFQAPTQSSYQVSLLKAIRNFSETTELGPELSDHFGYQVDYLFQW